MPVDTSHITIQVDGKDIQDAVDQNVLEVVVDQHTYLPAVFTIRVQDPDLKAIDEGPFDLTKTVVIESSLENGDPVTLIEGEITALEPVFAAGMVAELVVRGYDRSHRLYRQPRSKAYINMRDSDLASDIARAAGLQAEVETTPIPYEHIYQHNQTDLEFLRTRAWRLGFECFLADGKLVFRKPKQQAAAAALQWGEDLLSFQPRMSLAEQVDEVIVRGWDPARQAAIVGRAARGSLAPQIGEARGGSSWASDFGTGRRVIVDLPVASQEEADALAAARLDELSGAFVQAEGTAFRRPDLRAGQVARLEALGDRFSGDYLVTRAVHCFDATGLHTTFHVLGARSGLLSEQVAARQSPQKRWPGLVIGVVTNTGDPLNTGRVKVKFPWLAEDAESGWARVMGIGAGPEAGLYVIPEVGDEVLVAFEHADFSRPVVLGGLWNGQHDVPPEGGSASSGEAPLRRVWRSRSGHRIAVYDTQDDRIEIVTADNRQVVLDDRAKKIRIQTDGVEITLEDRRLTIKSEADVKVESGSNMEIKASGNITIEAGGSVDIKGSTINLN